VIGDSKRQPAARCSIPSARPGAADLIYEALEGSKQLADKLVDLPHRAARRAAVDRGLDGRLPRPDSTQDPALRCRSRVLTTAGERTRPAARGFRSRRLVASMAALYFIWGRPTWPSIRCPASALMMSACAPLRGRLLYSFLRLRGEGGRRASSGSPVFASARCSSAGTRLVVVASSGCLGRGRGRHRSVHSGRSLRRLVGRWPAKGEWWSRHRACGSRAAPVRRRDARLSSRRVGSAPSRPSPGPWARCGAAACPSPPGLMAAATEMLTGGAVIFAARCCAASACRCSRRAGRWCFPLLVVFARSSPTARTRFLLAKGASGARHQLRVLHPVVAGCSASRSPGARSPIAVVALVLILGGVAIVCDAEIRREPARVPPQERMAAAPAARQARACRTWRRTWRCRRRRLECRCPMRPTARGRKASAT